MKRILIIILINLLFSYLIIFSQEKKEEAPAVKTEESFEVKPTYENVSYNDILKKEADISALVDKINQSIQEMNSSRSLSKKSALKEEVNKLKEQLKIEMKDYAAIINAYNNKIFKKDIPIDPSVNTNEGELKNKETEIINFVDRINKKIEQANQQTNESTRRALIDEIERMKKELEQKKLEYFKLIKSYNAQVEAKI